MRKVLLPLLFLFAYFFSFGQTVSISTDRNNILYSDVDNPITIAVENYSCASLIVKIDNGKIEGSRGRYICHPEKTGKAIISVYKSKKGKLVLIEKQTFRVKRLLDVPNILFKIGPCGNGCSIQKSVLTAQQYVRADVVNTEFDIHLTVDSFTVYLYLKDTCIIKTNFGNTISDEIRNAFHLLGNNDMVVFRNIHILIPDKTTRQLEPVVIYIKEEPK